MNDVIAALRAEPVSQILPTRSTIPATTGGQNLVGGHESGVDYHAIPSAPRTSGTSIAGIRVFRSEITAGLPGAVTLHSDYYSAGNVVILGHSFLPSHRWVDLYTCLGYQRGQVSEGSPEPTPNLRVERIARIQAAFGLSILELAQVLRLSRPGLYKWLDSTKAITLQGAKRERLALIERMANAWHDHTTSPLSAVAHEPLSNGRSALELLTDEHCDEGAILRGLAEAAAKLQLRPASPSQRMAALGFSRRKSRQVIADDE